MFRTESLSATAGWLVLSDGTAFEGEIMSVAPLESEGVLAGGEVVFNTTLTGYQEVATDPSYTGQFVTFTNPHIGNYGCNQDDMESGKVWASGIVVRDYSDIYSNHRATGSLLELTSSAGVPLFSGVDTRALTRHVRSYGALGAVIGTGSRADLAAAAGEHLTTTGKDLATGAGRSERLVVSGPGPKLVALDYGMKTSIIRQLAKRFDLVVLPAASSADEVMAEAPAGVFVSNGPGDPAAIGHSDAQLQGIIGRVPVFGICLGHQLIARAIGAKTYKLEFGHHGGNHPVSRLSDRVVEITSQNHNYAVDRDSLKHASLRAEVTHLNLNDGVVEGFALPGERAISVQYHPEAAPGPHDSYYLFEEFHQMVAEAR